MKYEKPLVPQEGECNEGRMTLCEGDNTLQSFTPQRTATMVRGAPPSHISIRHRRENYTNTQRIIITEKRSKEELKEKGWGPQRHVSHRHNVSSIKQSNYSNGDPRDI